MRHLHDRSGRWVIMAIAAILVAGCATMPPKAGVARAPAKSVGPADIVTIPRDPYPSTYKPYTSTPTIIRGATIYDGRGGRIENGVLFIRDGVIARIGTDATVPAGVKVIDATGKWVTPGIIDIHSHLGDYPSPEVAAHADGNEITGPVRPEVQSEHSVWPQDPGFGRALTNGGVTSLHILPGSADLFGGRGTTFKNVPARTMQAMKFPGAPYSLKMACGENPKRVYGKRNQAPGSRMGNIAVSRQTWARAQEYRRKWQAYDKRARAGQATRNNAPARDLAMDTLAGVLEGQILVQNHCYRADDMANVIAMSREFGYRVTAFHHAVESYKIADILAREKICSAMWADWYGFKMESNDAINENIAFVHAAGACAIVHSDDPDGIQRLNQEAAKALASGRRAGVHIAPEEAWTWLAINPARALGIDDRTGSLEVGKMADVVLWDGDPLSTYAHPEKVWIDGALLYDMHDPQRRPISDFDLGQVGGDDVK